MGPWWINFIAGTLCTALAVNFFAQAYGLRLGGKPIDTSRLPVVTGPPKTTVLPFSQSN